MNCPDCGKTTNVGKPNNLMPLNAAMLICEMRVLDQLDGVEEAALRSLLWWIHGHRGEKTDQDAA